MRLLLILCPFIFLLLNITDLKAQVISVAPEPNYYKPVKHEILSSSQYENYRFRDPFKLATVNSMGNQFVIDEVNSVISFTIRQVGNTNSRQQNLYLLLNGIEVDRVSLQYGYYGTMKNMTERASIVVPNNSIWSRFQPTSGVLVPADAWKLGTKNWNNDIFISIYYSGTLKPEFGISLFANNPNRFSTMIDDIGDFVFAPVHKLLHLLGESTIYNSSFTNYRLHSPATESQFSFNVTANKYDDKQSWERAIQMEFGNRYKVADWNDLINFYQTGGNLTDLFETIGVKKGESVFVTRDGRSHFSNNRAYFASFHLHQKPHNYLAHQNLNRYEISLGSWHGKRRILVSLVE